jgi:hypothetical protein
MQMPALRFRRPSFAAGGETVGRLHCPIDDWDFDARYTEGACPICGWRPEGLAYAAPLWMRVFRALDWELVGLLVMVLLLVLLGILVERAAGLTPGDLGGFLSGR